LPGSTRTSQVFARLFQGGQAFLRLTDQENQAESGLEIVASPPGKKLQNVLLLSGGEKALTALALLVGIFQFQPSPFCVLDEVDAALDETNVGRFADLLHSLSKDTQFLLVTHSKRMMQSADMIYGVTMQEPGVSKVVSVRLGNARSLVAGAHLRGQRDRAGGLLQLRSQGALSAAAGRWQACALHKPHHHGRRQLRAALRGAFCAAGKAALAEKRVSGVSGASAVNGAKSTGEQAGESAG
jgi:hypothetical protein